MKKTFFCIVCILFLFSALLPITATATETQDYFPKPGTIKILKVQKTTEKPGKTAQREHWFVRIDVMQQSSIQNRTVYPLNYSYHGSLKDARSYKGQAVVTKHYIEKDGAIFLWATQKTGKKLQKEDSPWLYLPSSLKKGVSWTDRKKQIPFIKVEKPFDVSLHFDGFSTTERVANRSYQNCTVVRGEGSTKHTDTLSQNQILWRIEYRTVTVCAPNIGLIYQNRSIIAIDDSSFTEASSDNIEVIVGNLFAAKSVVELKITLMDFKLPPQHIALK